MKFISIIIAGLALSTAAHADTATSGTPDARLEKRISALPEKARAMRTMILRAARNADFSALADAIRWNELLPSFEGVNNEDPIPHFKKRSADGSGFETLALLSLLLEADHAVRKAENGKPDYIWPAAAELPWAKLLPSQKVDAIRILPPDLLKAYRAGGPYKYYAIMIGHDGTWHSFERE